MSANYCPVHPQKFFNGFSGGAMAARVFEKTLYTASSKFELGRCVGDANHEIGYEQQTHGLSLANTEDLAGCVFAAAKINEKHGTLDLVQVGDSAAIWQMRDGTIGITRNQTRAHDAVLVAAFSRIFHQVASEYAVEIATADSSALAHVRAETWNRYCAFSRERRRANANNRNSPHGYGVLNGMLYIGAMYQRETLPLECVRYLLLCTDGMIPWTSVEPDDEATLAEALLRSYYDGGLCGLLANARRLEREGARTSHTTGATEATAIAIEF